MEVQQHPYQGRSGTLQVLAVRAASHAQQSGASSAAPHKAAADTLPNLSSKLITPRHPHSSSPAVTHLPDWVHLERSSLR